jgi:hypothetical protein
MNKFTENMDCATCGMLVEPAMAFHPYLYCRLFKAGFLNPAAFLQGQGFIPDPAHWGDDAPSRQVAAAASRKVASNAYSNVRQAVR